MIATDRWSGEAMSETPVVLTTLSEGQSWRLLAAHRPRLGRIAFVDGGTIVVYPMNYAVTGRTLYVRTDPASRLTTVAQSQVVTFEVDDVDVAWERGWSVIVHGRLFEVVDHDELEEYRELQLRTWAPGERLHLLRLDVTGISGRRIESADLEGSSPI
jgi:nitroimidazol reductase NimA-like FMN-containing flavoprotein (pyridoxamine 5'-phosphate oxidase superfamily)